MFTCMTQYQKCIIVKADCCCHGNGQCMSPDRPQAQAGPGRQALRFMTRAFPPLCTAPPGQGLHSLHKTVLQLLNTVNDLCEYKNLQHPCHFYRICYLCLCSTLLYIYKKNSAMFTFSITKMVDDILVYQLLWNVTHYCIIFRSPLHLAVKCPYQCRVGDEQCIIVKYFLPITHFHKRVGVKQTFLHSLSQNMNLYLRKG